jgi:CRP-like cAMP-binding protein
LSDKSTTEISLIGNEGMVGLPVFLGANYATSYTMVQVADSAMKVNAQIFKEESQKKGELQRLLLLYIQARLTQISQNLVCKSHHQIENQFACWLLFVHDGVNKDELLLTQHFIAQMLGVRRASISEIAQKFQKAGIISYNRGNINILNRAMLESRACECYELVKAEFRNLLNFH